MVEFLAIHNGLMYRFYFKWIGDIFLDEFHLAHVSSHETVLHMGCGVLPTMSLLAAEQAHAKVTALDHNLKVVLTAQWYIHKKKVTDCITVIHGEGTTFPVDSYDVIFIALNVTPIDAVFRHLASQTKPTVRIICRDLGNGMSSLLENDEFRNYFVIQSIQRHAKISSVLILRKK
jgi:2-polyprenyl-3-methyl-5-hydroxy-6-metoxy-1,4-benzoquinol methylase